MNQNNRKRDFTIEAMESQMRSKEILRVAKAEARKSHQAALLAKKAYKNQCIRLRQKQRD